VSLPGKQGYGAMSLDLVDRKILQIIQSDFPLVARPYLQIAAALGLSEGEVLERLQSLQERGVIRRLGGLFNSRALGYTGTLCALRVPPGDIERVAAIVNSYPGVTHNYLRNHDYNMWFTLLAPSEEQLNETVAEIRRRTGIQQMIELPAVNLFKVRVNFEL